MPDPVTLAAIGAVALTEGIKFLYGQAGEALKKWQERKKEGGTADRPAVSEPLDVELPSTAFANRLEDPRLDFGAISRLEVELRDLRAAVADYAQEIDVVDPHDERLLATVAGLRQAMEAVYGQAIVFRGEARPASGDAVLGEAVVDEARGYVAGLRAQGILSGSVTGRVTARTVEPSGEAVGLEVGTIGSPALGPPPGNRSEP